MKTEQHTEQSMRAEQIREALDSHWRASASGDVNAEHDIYDDNVICDYPQSGERIHGRSNLQALRSQVTILVSRQVSRSSEFSDTVISGLRNT
jgi:ketosteroid isomerase-like protein